MKVVVVGAGMIGLCSAWYLRRSGCDVTVVAVDEPGAGASAVNAGWVVPALSGPVPGPGVLSGSLRWMLNPASPFYVRPRPSPSFVRWLLAFRSHCNARDYAAGLDALAELNRRTLALYDGLAADGLAFQRAAAGLVMAFRSRRDFEHELAGMDWLGRFGFPAPVVDEPQVIEPALSDEIQAAFLLPGERHVDPASLTAALVRDLASGGVAMRRATVRSIDAPVGRNAQPGGQVRLLVDAGGDETGGSPEVLAADAAVIAAGAWTPLVVRSLRVRVPIIAGKGYALDFESSPVRPAHPVYLHEDRVAVSPYPDHLRLSGTMELTGIDQSVSPRRTAAIARAGARGLRGWPAGARPARVAAGMRPLTPDGLPVIGRVAPGVFVAAGHAMLGVTLGPATGEGIAQLVGGERPGVLAPFDPSRFR